MFTLRGMSTVLLPAAGTKTRFAFAYKLICIPVHMRPDHHHSNNTLLTIPTLSYVECWRLSGRCVVRQEMGEHDARSCATPTDVNKSRQACNLITPWATVHNNGPDRRTCFLHQGQLQVSTTNCPEIVLYPGLQISNDKKHETL